MRRIGRNTLRTRIIGVMFAVFVLVAVSFTAVLKAAVTRSFSELEADRMREDSERVQTVFYTSLDSLERVAADWAKWTDTYEFIAGRYPDYPAENLSAEVLRDVDMDFALFLTDERTVAYCIALDPVTGEVTQLGTPVKQTLVNLSQDSMTADGRSMRSGFAALPGMTAAVVMHPITTSDGRARPNGVMVVGRYVGAGEAAEVERLANLDVKVARPTARASILPEHPHGDGEVLGQIYVDSHHIRAMESWATLPGMDGRAAFVYAVTEPRATMERASSTVAYVGVGLLVFTLFFGFALALTLDFTIMRRLTRLHDEVRASGGGANGRRVTVDGDDEIAELAEALNRNFDGLAEAEAALTHAADHDFLTGLLNRRRLEEDMATAFAESERTGQTVAYIMFDLDGFKGINDAMGHHCGDQVLIWFADLLRSEVRSYSTIARLGGDEFAILMPRAGDFEAAVVADRIMTALSEQPCSVCDGGSFYVGASLGIAISPRDGTTMNDICRAADSGMYATKSARARDSEG